MPRHSPQLADELELARWGFRIHQYNHLLLQRLAREVSGLHPSHRAKTVQMHSLSPPRLANEASRKLSVLEWLKINSQKLHLDISWLQLIMSRTSFGMV